MEQVRGPGHNNLKSEVDVRLPALLSSNTEHFYMFIGRAEYIIFNSKKKRNVPNVFNVIMCLMLSFNLLMINKITVANNYYNYNLIFHVLCMFWSIDLLFVLKSFYLKNDY